MKPPTERQLEVLRLAALGYPNPQIGRELWLSESTVKTHLREATKNLGAKDRTNAVVIALLEGWLQREPTDTGYDVKVVAPSKCGTNKGYVAHRARGEKPCRPCLDGHNQYQRGWLARTTQPVAVAS